MENQSEISKVFRRAAEIIDTPDKWTQYASARDCVGAACNALHKSAVCWCVSGAISKAADEFKMDPPLQEFSKFIGQSILVWNDTFATHKEVVETLRMAGNV